MEVHAIDTLSGREEPLEIDADATVSAMKRQCGEAFGFGEDVELSVSGQRVACDGAERVSNVAAFSGGCRVGVVRGVAEFVAQLRSGAVKMDDIPVWARQRRECVLALLACALQVAQWLKGTGEGGCPAIPPHWVHPSLHDDKEVMLQYMKCYPKAFLRASATLRSDADVVIAALKQDASLWHHVEDKSLQEQRSVALRAVPYCANSAVWLSDKAFVLEALENSAVWEDVSKALKQDKEIVLKALACRKLNDFYQLSVTLQQDKDVVLVALDRIAWKFGDLSEALRGDNNVVMKALECGKLSKKDFRRMSATLQEDKEVAMQALCTRTVAFGDLSEALRGDKAFVMRALAHRQLDDFRHITATLQQDEEVVLKALDQAVVTYGDLSAALREDKEVVMKALQRKVGFGDLSEALRGDKEFVMQVIACRKLEDFHQLSATLQQDKEVVMKAFDYGVSVKYGDLCEKLRGDKGFALRALVCHNLKYFHDLSATLQQDKEVVIKALDFLTVPFDDLSEQLKGDKEVILKALRKKRVMFSDLSEALRGDKDVLLAWRNLGGFPSLSEMLQEEKQAFMDAPFFFQLLSPALQQDKEVAIKALCVNRVKFCDLSETLRGDKQVAMAALRVHIVKFGDLSETLRGDRDFVMETMRDSLVTVNVGDLSEKLRNDKELVMKVLACGRVQDFRQLSATVQQDKEVVMKAFDSPFMLPTLVGPRSRRFRERVPEGTMNFSNLCENLREDKEVVMKALACHKLSVFHQLSPSLQQDKEIVMQALLRMRELQFGDLSKALQGDKAFVMEAITRVIIEFCDLSENLRGDKDVVMASLAHHQLNDFRKLSATLQRGKEVAMQAFKYCDRMTFCGLSESLQADKTFVVQAIINRPDAYASLTGPLRQDKGVALSLVARRADLFASMVPALRDDVDVALPAIRANPHNFIYAGDSVRADKQAALAAFCEDWEYDDPHAAVLLPFASAELQADREVVLAAVRANAKNAEYAIPAPQDLAASGP